jgi:hypothetical protein
LLSNASITFGGAGGSRSANMAPAAGQHGTTLVTITVSDGNSSSNVAFTLTVTGTPTIGAIADQTTLMGVAVATGVTVGDLDTALNSLILSATSTNPTLLPNAAITFDGTGASRTMTLTPAAGQTGTATVAVTVSDGTNSASTSFTLTVTATPTISGIANQSTLTGTAVSAGFTVGDVDTALASLTLSGTSSNTTLLPNASIAISGSGATRTVTMTPAAGLFGTTTVTITVSDGGASASTTFTLTVLAAPTISSISNQTTPFGTARTVNFSIGDDDTPRASLVVSGSSSNPTLVPDATITFDGTGAARSARLTPATGQHGSTTITLTVSDGTFSASTSFVLTVLAPPTILPIADQTTFMNAAASVPVIIADPDTGLSGLTVTATSGNPTVVPNGGLAVSGSDATRTLTFTPATGATGSAVITVTVTDGTHLVTTTFTLNVVPLTPGPITNLAAAVSGNTVTFTWTAPATGLPPTNYQVNGSLAPGAPPIATLLTGSTATTFTVTAPDGQYFVTIRAINSAGTGPIGPEVGLNVGSASVRPGPPLSLASTVTGDRFTLNWLPPDFGAPLTTYVLEVGTSTGASNLANFALGSTGTTFTTPSVPNGRYFVRLRSRNAAGESAPSREILVVVGPPPPGAPTLTGSASAGAVSLSWTAPTSGGAATTYQIQAGSASGLSNLARLIVPGSQLSFSTGGVPAGTYFVRIVAVNGAGEGPASNEIRLVVP